MIPGDVVVGDPLLAHDLLQRLEPAESFEDIVAELGERLPRIGVAVVEALQDVGLGEVGVGQEEVGGEGGTGFFDALQDAESVVGVAQGGEGAFSGSGGFRAERCLSAGA